MQTEYDEIRESLIEARDARVAVLAARYAERAGRENAVKVYTDRGERWDTASDAARAVGVGRDCVLRAVRRAIPLVGRMWARIGEPMPSLPSVVVSNRGESWQTTRDCAAAMGVPHYAVRRRIASGVPVDGRTLSKGPDWERFRHGPQPKGGKSPATANQAEIRKARAA